MAQYVVKKSFFHSGAIFNDEYIKVLKKRNEIIIPTEAIEYIEYSKPTLLNYIFAIPCWFSGVYPGRFEIHLNRKIGATRLYIIRIKKEDLYKLPQFYKIKIGYSDIFND